MTNFNLSHDPEGMARAFSQYVKAIVWILFWAIIAMASIATAYVAARGLWVAVKLIVNGLGI